MYQALLLKHSEDESIPSESTVYRVMKEIGITHRPRRKPNGITKAELFFGNINGRPMIAPKKQSSISR